MARDTPRKLISEAVRLSAPLWSRQTYGNVDYGPGGTYVEYVSTSDEALYVEYTKAGNIRRVTYRHWDSGKPGHPIVCTESPKRDKLGYALHQIGIPAVRL